MKFLFYLFSIGTVLLAGMAIAKWQQSEPVIGYPVAVDEKRVPETAMLLASGNLNLQKQHATYLLIDFTCKYSKALLREVQELDGELPQNCQIYLINNPIFDGSREKAAAFVDAGQSARTIASLQTLLRDFDGHPEAFLRKKPSEKSLQIVAAHDAFADTYAGGRAPVMLHRFPDGHFEEIPSIQHLRKLFRQIVTQDARLAPACCSNPPLE